MRKQTRKLFIVFLLSTTFPYFLVNQSFISGVGAPWHYNQYALGFGIQSFLWPDTFSCTCMVVKFFPIPTIYFASWGVIFLAPRVAKGFDSFPDLTISIIWLPSLRLSSNALFMTSRHACHINFVSVILSVSLYCIVITACKWAKSLHPKMLLPCKKLLTL